MHALDDTQSTATDDTTVPTDAPTLSEVESAIKKLKLSRAPGGDCIAPEMLKLAPTSAASALHKLFGQVWISSHVPSEWKEGTITSLYKGKGPSRCGRVQRNVVIVNSRRNGPQLSTRHE